MLLLAVVMVCCRVYPCPLFLALWFVSREGGVWKDSLKLASAVGIVMNVDDAFVIVL